MSRAPFAAAARPLLRSTIFAPKRWALALAASAALIGGPQAYAQDETLEPSDRHGAPPERRAERATLALVNENDLWGGTDRAYTNGLLVSYLSAPNTAPKWVRDAAAFLPFVSDNSSLRRGFGVGQSIFTPEDIETAAALNDQRPYAGWLYGAFTLVSARDWDLERPDRRASVVNTLQINAGVVGPLAFGEQVQNSWHRLIGAERAAGWDNQLGNEPGLQLLYERRYRGLVETDLGGLDLSIEPHLGASLGNVATYGAAGFTVRAGRNLTSDFGPPRIRPALAGASFFAREQDVNAYIFGGIEARGVARNIFLDGNTFRTSQSVEKRNYVGDAQVGLAVQLGRAQAAFTYVYRLEEYDGQPSPDRFGAVSLQIKI
ncbi:MAG: lipid A deacylase LpxR family protein [Pseudomonadota bacterium]